MEEIKLLTVPMEEYYYSKLRNAIIDRVDIDGYDFLVKKGIENVANWREIGNPYLRRSRKLLSIIHSDEEIEFIVKDNLDYFLKGYKPGDKKIHVAGGSNDFEDFLDWLFQYAWDNLIPDAITDPIDAIRDFFEPAYDPEWDIYGDEGDWDDINWSIPPGYQDGYEQEDEDRNGSMPPKPKPPKPTTPFNLSVAVDSEDGGIADVSVRSVYTKSGVASDAGAGKKSFRDSAAPPYDVSLVLPYDLQVMKSLKLAVTGDQKFDKSEAVHELLTDYLLKKFDAEGRLFLVEDTLRKIKSDRRFVFKAGYEKMCKLLDFLYSRKSTIEKQLLVLNNNMAYYQQKLKGA